LPRLFALSREEQRSIVYNLRDLHGRNPKTCKLILLRLNDVIAGVAQRFVPEGLTVEHVLPKKTGTNSPWRPRFPDSEQRERCVTSLGNLVLVSKAQNDKAANLDFANKLDVYFNTPGVPIGTHRSITRSQELDCHRYPAAGRSVARTSRPPMAARRVGIRRDHAAAGSTQGLSSLG
jgi:Protein of unknown function (DUF1524)